MLVFEILECGLNHEKKRKNTNFQRKIVNIFLPTIFSIIFTSIFHNSPRND